MTHTLLVYDRAAGLVKHEQTFATRKEALTARFKAERTYRSGGSNIEVVVLTARSKADLMRTHSRYFRSLAELTSPTS